MTQLSPDPPNIGSNPAFCYRDGTPWRTKADSGLLFRGAPCPIDGQPLVHVGSMTNCIRCNSCGYTADVLDWSMVPGTFPMTANMLAGYWVSVAQDFGVLPVGEVPEFAKTWDHVPTPGRRNLPTPEFASAGVPAPVDSSATVAGVPPGHPASYCG